jgi:PAS domain S-box-containing protein
MDWSGSRRIILGFTVAIILFVINAVVSYSNIVALSENDRWVSHTYQVLGELEGLMSTVKDVESNQRGYLLTQMPRYLEPYRAAIEATRARMARLKQLTADNSQQQQTLTELDRELEARIDYLARTMELVKKQGLPTLRDSKRIEEGQQLMDAVRNHIHVLMATEQELLRARSVESAQRYDRTLATVILATLLGLVLTGAGFALLRTYLAGQKAAADQLQAAHDELENRVRDRTADLAAINRALESEVTARQRIAEQLERTHQDLQFSNARLAAILEGTSDQIAALDLSGRFIMFNQAYVVHFERLFNCQPELGHSLAGEVPAEHGAHDRKLALWKRALAGDEFTVTEDFGVVGEGQRFFEITFGSVRDAQGHRIGASHIGRDVTARILAERQLKASTEQLKRSNRELEEFAGVASHDLQEPLRKIQAFGDRLETQCTAQLGDQGRDYLGRMLQASTRMRTLINDLLTFSRISTRTMPFDKLDLARVAQEVVSDLDERIRQTGGQVVIGKLPVIHADPLQMRQLLQNLIGNALKFHQPGHPPVVRVEAHVGSTEDKPVDGQAATRTCQLVVSDNGIGFDIKYLDRIFNVFQRLHGRAEYEGTGMGLAICRKIVERHRGTITATSQPGSGASFVVTLPLEQTDLGDHQHGEAA